ncbi:MAG: UDP-2,4-diacetamido-2,4,6-trideoxy-beta-L-altropyranose hydrolase [Kurthia gibsonii]
MWKVIIRVDASQDIGSGHVMRCLTLAYQLQNCGHQVKFICREADGDLENYIREQGFEVRLLPYIKSNIWEWMKENYKQDVNETTQLLKNEMIDLLIVDHYSIDEKWEKVLSKYVKKIMVIDDLANRRHHCDLLLDQNYYKNKEIRYQKYISNETIQCLGPNFMLVREEFYASYSTNQQPTIFIFFGSVDQTNETLKVLKALGKLQKKRFFHIITVVGSINPKRYEIEAYCQSLSSCEFHCQVDNMAELMAKAHFSITSGGTITWERAMMGLMGIVITVADNQIELTENLNEQQAICYLGESIQVSEEMIYNQVLEIFQKPNLLKTWQVNMNKIFNKEYVMKKPLLEKINEVMADVRY